MEGKDSTEAETNKEELVYRAPYYRKYYATNVMVTSTEEDFRVEFFNERVETDHGTHAISESAAILSLQAAKVLVAALQGAVENMEKAQGPIKVTKTPVLEKRAARKERKLAT